MLGEGRRRAVDTKGAVGVPATRAERAYREPGVWRDPVGVDDRDAGVRRLLRDLALPAPAALARLLGPGHLHRVRQAAVAAAGADRGRPRARVQPARRSLPGRPGGAGAVLPAVPLARHPAVLPGAADRAVGVPGHRGRVSAPRTAERTDDRVRLRLLLGPAADDRLRLPRDRARGAAARVLALGAGPRPGARDRAVGPAAGVHQGRPGFHGRRDRRAAALRRRPRPRRRVTASRPARKHRLGRAAVRLGAGLVGAGHHGDHSALQPAARVLLLEGRRRRRQRQGLLPRRAGGADGDRLAGQAADRGHAAAADRVRGPRLAARAGRAAEPGAQVRLHQPGLLGHQLALQRHPDADPVHRRRRRARPLAGRGFRPRAGPARRPAGRASATAPSGSGSPSEAAWPGTARR